MKILAFLFLSLTVTIFGQYIKNDRQLAATTYTRNFDKVTLKEYLTSKDDDKVIAALLSVSHSEDTAFVPAIISLPFEKFGHEICFALGQLGECKTSANYLKKLFYNNDVDPLLRYYSLITLGKVADSIFAKRLIFEFNNADSKAKFNGVSLALYYFFSNGNISANDARPVLERELYSSSSRQFEAAFSLYRIGPVPEEEEILVGTLKKILNAKLLSDVTEKPVAYLLACLRKLQFFPDDYGLLAQLKSLKDFQSEVEAVRASAYYNFKSQSELDNYLQYLSDENKNVSREAAASLKNLNLKREMKDYLYLKLSELLHGKNEMDKYTQGEMFLSYLSLFPQDFNDVFINFFNDKISSEYLYKICAVYPQSEEALKILSDKYFKENLSSQITILESILNFDQKKIETSRVLYSALNSNEPSLISISAEGIDSSFINDNEDSLVKIISHQVEINVDNADFIESLMSLEKLSGRVSVDYQKRILDELSNSKIYSLRKFVCNLEGKSILSVSKNIDHFNDCWDEAFKYKQAEIVTNEGTFVISFLPGYAPISVGNFCYLANKGFYNGIQFHRVVPGFVIQGGDSTSTGWGGPGYEIVSEFSPLEFNRCIVGMASAGKDTEGSQWFVTTGNYPHLNGKYTIFAEVLRGMDIVEKINQGDKIIRINLIR